MPGAPAWSEVKEFDPRAACRFSCKEAPVESSFKKTRAIIAYHWGGTYGSESEPIVAKLLADAGFPTSPPKKLKSLPAALVGVPDRCRLAVSKYRRLHRSEPKPKKDCLMKIFGNRKLLGFNHRPFFWYIYHIEHI